MLLRLGYFLGTDLNHASDNLWFTLLLKRPGWLRKATAGQVRETIELFRSVMVGRRC